MYDVEGNRKQELETDLSAGPGGDYRDLNTCDWFTVRSNLAEGK